MLRNGQINWNVRKGIAEGIGAAQPSADVIREMIQIRSNPQIDRNVCNEIDRTLLWKVSHASRKAAIAIEMIRRFDHARCR